MRSAALHHSQRATRALSGGPGVGLGVGLSALALAACGSAVATRPNTRLETEIAVQAHAFLTGPAYERQITRSLAATKVAKSAAGQTITTPGVPLSAAAATARIGAQSNAATPASAYTCTVVGSGDRQHTSCSAPLAGGGNVTATASCNTSTGRCEHWVVGPTS